MVKSSEMSEKSPISLDDSIDFFVDTVANKPEIFVASADAKKGLESNIIQTLKTIFDFASHQKISIERPGKKAKKTLETTPLSELLIEGVDSEQIWEQIQLHQSPLLKFIERTLEKQFDGKENQIHLNDLLDLFGLYSEEENGEDEEGDEEDDELEGEEEEGEEDDDEELEGEEDELEEEDEEEEEEDDEEDEGKEKKTKGLKEDRFFSQAKMENFFEEMEKREMEGGDDFLDLDEDDEEEGEGIGMNDADAKYNDFFDDGEEMEGDEEDEGEDDEDDIESEFLKENRDKSKKDEKKGGLSKLFDEQEEEDLELGTGLKTAFERRADLLKQRIEKLEEAAVAEKPWTMIGEVRSKKRPLNSLLEAELDFESAAKPVPIITEETTDSLEEMIKQRIRDASFDDVIRKKIIQTNWKPRMELDHEKSKLSLAEIYEKEYETQVMGKKKEETPLDKIHKSIEQQFKRLCSRLDALSNFHFTPKEVTPDVVIKQKDIGSIMQEDITPLVHSKEMTLAPAEIYAPKEKSKLAQLDAAKEHGEITQKERGKRRALIKDKHRANREADAKKIKEKELADPLYAQKRLASKKGEEEARKKITEHRNTKLVGDAAENITKSTDLFKLLQREQEGKTNPKTVAKKDPKPVSSSKFKL
eukprot:TRINITY_DN3486_c0_g1_i2.p1 TRINITY_DN3486_c0_g1~~TRINITY_DN3486_c0_g1_i2.p1  ORF type:complete len:646 (+),score=376.65 TRINITY_DN3486_c0_g1_i2:80-2017(+)